MSIINKTIDEATDAQIRDYATRFLNLDLSGNETPSQILAKVKKVQTHDNIFVESDDDAIEAVQDAAPEIDAPVVSAPSARSSGSLGREDPRVTINIQSDMRSADGSKNDDVQVAVNGVAWLIKRGVDVDVPLRVVEALNAAKELVIRHDDEGEVMETIMPRFNISYPNGAPSRQEIAEWHAKTDHLELA